MDSINLAKDTVFMWCFSIWCRGRFLASDDRNRHSNLQNFLLRSDNINFPRHKLQVCFHILLTSSLWLWRHLEVRDSFWGDVWSLSLQMISQLRFFGVFLRRKVNARRSIHSPRFHFIITLEILKPWLTWHSVQMVVRENPVRSWWRHQTSIKIFW